MNRQVVSDVHIIGFGVRDARPLPPDIEIVVRDAANPIDTDDSRNVVLNLVGIPYVDSAVLEILVNRFKRSSGEDRQLRLCCLETELAHVRWNDRLDGLSVIDATDISAIPAAS